MIDTWFFAALCFGVLAAGSLLRIIRTKTRHDRILAATVAVTAGSAAGLVLAIGMGTLLVLDATIVLALVCFGIIVASSKFSGEAVA